MRATFRFEGDLRIFLARRNPAQELEYEFPAPGSVKDAIEALGVPHPEVGSVVINGSPAGFDQLLRDGDVVAVHPCRPADAPAGNQLPCIPPGTPRFVLDVHLGTLARYLRLLGYDTLYRNNFTDEELAHVSAQQNRILLTRDIGLLKRSVVRFGRFMRSVRPHEQLLEIARRFALRDWVAPFTRCLECNGTLAPVAKQSVIAQVPERVVQHFEHFRQCAACRRVYWEGSHMARMRLLIDSVLHDATARGC